MNHRARSRISERPRPALTLIVLLGVLTGCASTGAPDTRRELLTTWSNELIVPIYAELEERSQALDSSLGDMCASPSEASLEAAKRAWSVAREPLKRGEVFAFGPFSRPEYRIGPKLDSWPARPEEVEELLASASPVDPQTIGTLGVWHKGLPVIEYLLYPPEGGATALLSDARRCEYLRSVGAELVSRARELHLAWAPEGGNFAAELSGAGRTSTAFRSLKDAFGEIVNRLGFTLENVRKDKLGRPLGDSAGGIAQPAVAESRFSGRSLRDILDNLDGIELVFFGDASRTIPGVAQYARERGQSFDPEVTAGLAAARDALLAIDVPLTEAVATESERVREASARLGELQSLFQVEIIGALGLTLSFNDNDGD